MPDRLWFSRVDSSIIGIICGNLATTMRSAKFDIEKFTEKNVFGLWRVNMRALVSKEYYAPALGGIMLSIGIKLSIDDFALAFQRPLPLCVGYAAQYVLKPLLGLLIARVFRVPSMFCAGFILTSCVAGAQLSSYASFLSKGDVSLSILLTSITTISSVIVTPFLTGLLIGSVVPVDPVAMSKSILQVILKISSF
ncbi:probable sodium/metabolite cotransporter BASS3, chloroplastic [Phalaenopsis equestris]|uniref:probable sodium/metabolite cotransporter BASS3, chloroplastic n=1 Tax=Phalaenopsis equestris TaxID=78828 RepID=UPI0009E50E20|nr:probable sodium/metabolite cotransporter BASS3, chloroplastic [Phalaenopsis equestris]